MLDSQIASIIDHTLLTPEASASEIDRLCAQAREHLFAAVCVHGRWIPRVATSLAGTSVRPCAVADFPHGGSSSESRAILAASLVRAGAVEVDIVIPLPLLLAGDESAMSEDLCKVVQAMHSVNPAAGLKVILESALPLSTMDSVDAEKCLAAGCRASKAAGASFVKTSTGFHPSGGASVEAVRLLAKHAMGMGVKASGGIRTRAEVGRMIEAGATRIGCSRSIDIVRGV